MNDQSTNDASRRDFLRRTIVGIAGAMTGTTLSGCSGPDQKKIRILKNEADLMVALKGSGLYVQHLSNSLNGSDYGTVVKIEASDRTCARFLQQADSMYLVYFYNVKQNGEVTLGDPGNDIDAEFETTKIFDSIDSAAKFLRETFGTEQTEKVVND